MAKLTAETYTDEELLALYRQALAEGSVSASMTFRGKTVVRPSIDKCKEMIPWLESRISAASGRSNVVHTRHARR